MSSSDTTSWIPDTVERSLENLHMLSNMLKKASEEDPFDEDVFQLSNWLIVRACGHLEITEKACVGNLFYRLYGNVVYDYLISTTFSKGRNPHPDTLKSLLKTLIGQQKPDPAATLHLSFNTLLSKVFEDAKHDEFIGKDYRSCLKQMVDARNSLVHGEGADKSWKMALDSAVIAEIISNWYVDMFKPKGSAHILLDSLSGSTNSLPIINSE